MPTGHKEENLPGELSQRVLPASSLQEYDFLDMIPSPRVVQPLSNIYTGLGITAGIMSAPKGAANPSIIVPFGEWEKNPRLSGEDFSRPAGPES